MSRAKDINQLIPNAFYVSGPTRHAVKYHKLAPSALFKLAPKRPIDVPGRNAQHFGCRADKCRLQRKPETLISDRWRLGAQAVKTNLQCIGLELEC
jgi:hypothetical protein